MLDTSHELPIQFFVFFLGGGEPPKINEAKLKRVMEQKINLKNLVTCTMSLGNNAWLGFVRRTCTINLDDRIWFGLLAAC